MRFHNSHEWRNNRKISDFMKNRLLAHRYFFFTQFKKCMCGRKEGQDSAASLFLTALYGVYYNVNMDVGYILWNEFVKSWKGTSKSTELSSHRFWSVILHSVYTKHKIPFDSIKDPPMKCHIMRVRTNFNSQDEFDFASQVPDSMLHRIPKENIVLQDYKRTRAVPFSHSCHHFGCWNSNWQKHQEKKIRIEGSQSCNKHQTKNS